MAGKVTKERVKLFQSFAIFVLSQNTIRHGFIVCFVFFQLIHEAVWTGCLDCVRLLLDAGADVNAPVGNVGVSALSLAIEFLGSEHEVVKLLKNRDVMENRGEGEEL